MTLNGKFGIKWRNYNSYLSLPPESVLSPYFGVPIITITDVLHSVIGAARPPTTDEPSPTNSDCVSAPIQVSTARFLSEFTLNRLISLNPSVLPKFTQLQGMVSH
jgi:hypothetical protein